MSDRYLIVDDATGKYKRGAAVGGATSFVDEEFDVASPQAQFTLASSISGGTKIDVYTNGVKRREGAGNSWQRNLSPARIDFTENQPASAWILVRIWG